MFVKKRLYSFIDPIIAGAGIMAAGSLAGGLFGGKGKTSSKNKPADPTPDQQRMWQDFMNYVYGASPKKDFDPVYYASKYKDLRDAYDITDPNNMSEKQINKLYNHWDKYGKEENRVGAAEVPPEDQVSLQDRMAQDIDYSKGVDTTFKDTMSGLTGDYLSSLGGITDQRLADLSQYKDSAQGYTNDFISQLTGANTEWKEDITPLRDAVSGLALSAPMNVRLVDAGGQALSSTPFLTGSQRYAQGQYRGITDDILSNANLVSDKSYLANKSLADLIKGAAMEGGDYKSDLASQTMNKNAIMAQLINSIDKQYTPNKAEREYGEYINQLAQADLNRRYGIAGQSQTAGLNSGQMVADSVSDIGRMLMLFGMLPGNQQQQTQPQTTSGGLVYPKW